MVQADTVDVTANRGRTWRQVLFEGGTVVSVTPQLSEHGLDGVIEVLVSSGQGCSTNGRCRAVAGAKRRDAVVASISGLVDLARSAKVPAILSIGPVRGDVCSGEPLGGIGDGGGAVVKCETFHGRSWCWYRC